MGVSESIDKDVQETLLMLRNMSDLQVETALAKLEHLTKEKFQMQITKWDLYLLLNYLNQK